MMLNDDPRDVCSECIKLPCYEMSRKAYLKFHEFRDGNPLIEYGFG